MADVDLVIVENPTSSIVTVSNPVITVIERTSGNTGEQGPKGDQGDPGPTGDAGRTVLNGTTTPGSGIGMNGDFYLNTITADLYGPKTAGAWGSPVNLKGPKGDKGDTGDVGPTGASGVNVKGPWSGATVYVNKDAVTYGGSLYITDGTSTTGVVPTNDDGVTTNTGWTKLVAEGAKGDKGDKGDDGDPGPSGSPGSNGTNGADGKSVLSGTTVPDNSLGNNGDFYYKYNTDDMYGPKTSGVWGSAHSLKGPQGDAGPPGTALTNEEIQDQAFANNVAGTSGINTLMYDDADNRIELKLSADAGNVAVAGTDGYLHVTAQTPLTNEQIQDAAFAAQTAGTSGINSLMYDDTDNRLELALSTDSNNQASAGTDGKLFVASSSMTNEAIQDAAFAGQTPGTGSDYLVYNDTNNRLEVSISNEVIQDAAYAGLTDSGSNTGNVSNSVRYDDVNNRPIVAVSATAGNLLTTNTDGLYASAMTNEAVQDAAFAGTTASTSGINAIRYDDVDNRPELLLSTDANNGLSAGADGGVFINVTTKANLASPTLTGTPAAPTATAGTNTTQIATTAFVTAAVSNAALTNEQIQDSAFAGQTTGTAGINALRYDDVDNRLELQLSTDANNGLSAGTDGGVFINVTTKADLASPTFTGTPAAPTATGGTNTTQIATTAFVTSAISAAVLSNEQIQDAAYAGLTDSATNTGNVANALRYDDTNNRAILAVSATANNWLSNLTDGVWVGPPSGNETIQDAAFASQTAGTSGINSLMYDDADNRLELALSTDASNAATAGTDGKLYVASSSGSSSSLYSPYLINNTGQTADAWWKYPSTGSNTAPNSTTATQGFAIPLIVSRTAQLKAIRAYQASTVSNSVYFGLYTAGSDGRPTSKIADLATMSTSTSAAVYEATLASAQSLTAGTLYWLVYWLANAGTFHKMVIPTNAFYTLTSIDPTPSNTRWFGAGSSGGGVDYSYGGGWYSNGTWSSSTGPSTFASGGTINAILDGAATDNIISLVLRLNYV